MKSKKFMAFTAVVVLVVGYAIYDYKSNEIAEKEKGVKTRLLNFPADQVSSFAIHNKDYDIELQRSPDGWKMIKPLADAANQTAAEEFVEGLATEKYNEVAVEGDSIDLSSFGLDQPKGTVSVTNNSGQKTEFKVGTLKNFQGDSFLQKDQEKKVYIASSTWFSKVDKKPLDFRDKRLMRLSNAKAEKIQLEKGKEKFQLVKKDGTWSLLSHPDWKLDQNKVRELLTMLNATEALEFIVEGPAKPNELQKWGLKNPRLKLTVDIKDHGPWTAEFAAGADKVHRVHVSEPDLVMKISPTDSDKFFQMTENYFRDRTEPFNFDKSKVKDIEIRLGKATGSLKSSDEKAHNLLSQLSLLKVADFEEGKNAKLGQEIILKGEKDDILHFQWGDLHESKSGNQPGKVYFAKSSLYPHGFTILESDVASLKLDEFVKKESVK